MRITALTIENFKGIREPARIEFKPVTLLYGPNSAGKSTIMQALHYAHELLERQNVDADLTARGGEFVDLGGFENFVYGHELSRQVKIRLDLDLEEDDIPEFISWPGHSDSTKISAAVSGRELPSEDWNLSQKVETVSIEMVVAWSEMSTRPYVKEYSTYINGESFGTIKANLDTRKVWISEINFNHSSFPILDPESFSDEDRPGSIIGLLYELVIRLNHNSDLLERECIAEMYVGLDEIKTALPNWEKPLVIDEDYLRDPASTGDVDGFPALVKELTAYLSQLIIGPGVLVRDALRKYRYLGPIREIPPRNFQTRRSENLSRWASGLAAYDHLQSADQTFLSNVNRWLSDKLSTGYVVAFRNYYKMRANGEADNSDVDRTKREQRLVLEDTNRGIDVQPQDIGIGISQVLPVIVSAFLGQGSLVAIEQPELHLHPRLQAELGEMFLFAALMKQKNSFIIETHSEHLLLRIMRKMRETALRRKLGKSEDVEQTSTMLIDEAEIDVKPQDVGLFYVESYTQTGEDENSNNFKARTIIREMPLSKSGELIKAWPGGFFEEGLREMF